MHYLTDRPSAAQNARRQAGFALALLLPFIVWVFCWLELVSIRVITPEKSGVPANVESIVISNESKEIEQLFAAQDGAIVFFDKLVGLYDYRSALSGSYVRTQFPGLVGNISKRYLASSVAREWPALKRGFLVNWNEANVGVYRDSFGDRIANISQNELDAGFLRLISGSILQSTHMNARMMGFVELFERQICPALCSHSHLVRILNTLVHQSQLSPKEPSLNSSDKNSQEREKRGKARVFDKRLIDLVFFVALSSIILGFGFILLGSYLATHNERRILGPALFGCGLLLPAVGLWLWWIL